MNLFRVNMLILFLLIMNFHSGWSQESNRDETTRIAIENVNVISFDFDKSRILRQQTVLISGETILAVCLNDQVTIPEGTEIIDGTDKYLIPGLSDMHVHLERFDDPVILKLFLSYGVTTVRNMDGRPYLKEWRDSISKGRLTGPDIYTSGRILEGVEPYWEDTRVVSNASESVKAVKEQYNDGYDIIKIYHTLSYDAFRAIMQSADKLGIAVAGHMPNSLQLSGFLKSGISSIEHLQGYDEYIESKVSPYKGVFHWSKLYLGMPADSSKIREAASLTSKHNVWNCPTLIQQDKVAPFDTLKKWYKLSDIQYLPPQLRNVWNPENLNPGFKQQLQTMGDEDHKILERGDRNRLQLVNALHEAGGGLLIGTDTPNPFVIPGMSVHEELQLFKKSGIDSYEVLKIAGHDAGRYINRFIEPSVKTGIIKKGYEADLLLLENNPLADISNTLELFGVMSNGTWFNKEEISRFRKEVVKEYEK